MNIHPFLQQLLAGQAVEWKPLGEICDIKKGKQLNKVELKEQGLYPAYNGGKTYSGWADCYNVEANTIIISQGGASAGFVNFITVPFWANAHCYYLLPNLEFVHNRYLYHFLKYNENYFMESQYGAGIPALSQAKLNGLSIPIPPLSVQTKIAQILDTMTAITAELTAELSMRNKQYQYYRDKLLSENELAKVGFEWKSLGEVGELIRGNGLTKKDLLDDGVPAIHYGQIYTHFGTFADKTKSFTSPEVAKKLRKAQYGDVLIAGTSENVQDVMKPVGWFGGEIVFSGDMFAFRPNNTIMTKYLTYMLQTTAFAKFKEKYAQGTKVIRIKSENFLNHQIPIPPLAEQARIVAILDKFDTLTQSISDGLPREIELRQQQYEYYREMLLGFERE